MASHKLKFLIFGDPVLENRLATTTELLFALQNCANSSNKDSNDIYGAPTKFGSKELTFVISGKRISIELIDTCGKEFHVLYNSSRFDNI